VGGNPGYNFSARDAALMFLLADDPRYCRFAVDLVDRQVAEAEAAIEAGGFPKVAGNSYLEAGPAISALAATLDACAGQLDPARRARWTAYAEQAVWNIWHHASAQWGGRPHPWSGWATDNPGNNYYYSFLEATMYWALASGSATWMDELRSRRLPPLRDYFSRLDGGGSSEGTGYGVSHMWLFPLYRLWRDATGEDLAGANRHLVDSIHYWAHATVPTLGHFAPIGDQARYAMPDLFDYNRALVLEARQLATDPRARDIASWWLGNISIRRMGEGFNLRTDLLDAGTGGAPPDALVYHATGVGHLFARTSWDRDAMWIAVVAGKYDESHAHQDQGGFTLYARDWLAVTSNIWTRSGINQGPQVHNVVRFERSDPSARQCQAPLGERVVHQCYPTRSTLDWKPGTSPGSFTATADLTAAYMDNPAVRSWRRHFEFGQRRLTVRDDFELGAGTAAIFQVNVPAEPRIEGREVVAGGLRMTVLEPADARISARPWQELGGAEFRDGWRIDVAGSGSGYAVRFEER
jgi:hypothetical protein